MPPEPPVNIAALAKINLSLEILRRRDDGYHDVATVLQTVDLADDLEITPAPEIIVEGDTEGIPPTENLVYRAARLLQTHLGETRGARVVLHKRIPLAAGLGGGSTDAAAALVGLCRLWDRELRRGELAALAAELGSDVPFFLYGGTALAEGRGERVTPLPPLRHTDLVLLAPAIDLPSKTATLYRSLDPADFTGGDVTRALVAALRKRLPPTPDELFNGFTRAALERFDGLEGYWSRFEEAGADNVHLCGAGPSLFSLARGRDEAESLHERCLAAGLPAFVVSAAPNPYTLR